MASAEMNPSMGAGPSFWMHLVVWFRSIPRSALLSMVGPSVLLVAGYLGWRYYGATWLDRSFYGLQADNIHVTPPPAWLKTPFVEEVYQGGELSKLSLLDSQTAAVIAHAFDKHPWVRKTHRVQPMAGQQVLVDIEYRHPVAMVYCEVKKGSMRDGSTSKDCFLPLDKDGVLLPTKDFTSNDVPNFIHIYPPAPGILVGDELKVGAPLGDNRIEEAVRLCYLLERFRESLKIDRVYVYAAPIVSKSKWILEIETKGGPRVNWGHAPGLESLGEPTTETKLKQLIAIVTDKNSGPDSKFDLSTAKSP